MNLREAIAVAIDFERNVRDEYLRDAEAMPDPGGRRIFAALAKEEQGHVEYLERCLAHWRDSGKVPNLPLPSVLPASAEWIAQAKQKVAAHADVRPAGRTELDALTRAVQREQESGAFYQKLVSQLPSADRHLFDRFVGIEEGHLALVQAQLDAVQNKGFWFDVSQFIQDG